MAVLLEAISVYVPCEALEERYPGGVAAYERDAPNATYCSDGTLTRVAFMAPQDVKLFVRRLENRGLNYAEAGRAKDIAVAEWDVGLLTPCDWIGLTKIMLVDPAGVEVNVAWHRGHAEAPTSLTAHPSWVPERSHLIRRQSDGVVWVRSEDRLDVYQAPDGTLYYAGRPFVMDEEAYESLEARQRASREGPSPAQGRVARAVYALSHLFRRKR